MAVLCKDASVTVDFKIGHILCPTPVDAAGNVYAAPNPRVAEAVGAAASHGGPYSVHRKPSTAATVPSALRAAQASHGPGARPRYYCSAMPWVECSELRWAQAH